MSLLMTIREKEFGAQIAEVVRVTGRAAGDVVRDEGRLFVKDVVRMTPPFGNAPSTESAGAQRKVGEKAVERDIKKFFGLVPDPAKIRDPRIRKDLERAIRKRNFQGIKNILRFTKIGQRAENVTVDPDEGKYEAARDNRGRIRRERKREWVIKEASLNRLIRKKKGHVGIAKSGWAQAAKALKASVPAWVARHSGAGVFMDKSHDPHAPMIRIGNAVPYMQAKGRDLRIVERALKNRLRNMRVKLERIAKSGWKKK